MIRSHKVFERARSEMDITIAFEAIIGGSNPSGRIVRVFDKYWLVKWRCRDARPLVRLELYILPL